MRKYRQLAGLILLICLPVMSLLATEEVQLSDFAKELLNNQYMKENLRLLGLADDAYAKNNYDDAVKYAQEAMKYAKMSDDYVSLQMKIKETTEAIAAAQARLDQVKKLNLHIKYAEVYGKAELVFASAQNFRSKESWDEAREAALQVVAILAEIPDVPVLAAQYRVKT